MAAHSTLRSSKLSEHVALLSKTYVKHRPVVQKLLTLGFVVYVLGSTYTSLSGKPSSSKKGKEKAKEAAEAAEKDRSSGKPPRVAVSSHCIVTR